MSKYINLRWSNYRIQHIARHNVVKEEVKEAIYDDPYRFLKRYKRSSQFPGSYFYFAFGSTSEGRLLTIILLNTEKNDYIPLTARDMSEPEKKVYLQRRR